MVIILATLVAAMLAYMFWRVVLRLRPDRVRFARNADRRHRIFSRKHRARFLLRRAYREPEDDPEWESEVTRRLTDLPR